MKNFQIYRKLLILSLKFRMKNSIQVKQLLILDYEMKQVSIKSDLETSFLKTKVKLLEETLDNKGKDLESLDAFKENNSHLLSLLDKYDEKLAEMQDDIDIRDLKINEMIEKYEGKIESSRYFV